ncbi:MAG: peptidylprolyl isomerase [Verrucomicrobiota bacterium]
MKHWICICILSLCSALASFAADSTNAPAPKAAAPVKELAVLHTSEGDMVIEFWPDTAPKTVDNFITLARKGFYDGTCFHRIIDGFMIQGGDPNTKKADMESQWGGGGPGYTLPGEVSRQPNRRHLRGVISMANSGSPDTAGSQFFICLASLPQLDGGYTTFGRLIKGDDVLARIGQTPVKPDSRGEVSRPIKRVELISVRILPADAVK